jgi:hypothetical protein
VSAASPRTSTRQPAARVFEYDTAGNLAFRSDPGTGAPIAAPGSSNDGPATYPAPHPPSRTRRRSHRRPDCGVPARTGHRTPVDRQSCQRGGTRRGTAPTYRSQVLPRPARHRAVHRQRSSFPRRVPSPAAPARATGTASCAAPHAMRRVAQPCRTSQPRWCRPTQPCNRLRRRRLLEHASAHQPTSKDHTDDPNSTHLPAHTGQPPPPYGPKRRPYGATNLSPATCHRGAASRFRWLCERRCRMRCGRLSSHRPPHRPQPGPDTAAQRRCLHTRPAPLKTL